LDNRAIRQRKQIMKKLSKKFGYTLVEILLVVSLIAIISVSAFPVTRNFLDRNEYDSAFRLAINGIRSAQLYSQTGRHDTAWGVSFQSGAIVVYSGPTYAGRNPTFDETSPISTKISITGASEINFDKVTGNSPTSPTITISGNGFSRNVIINRKGLPIY